MSDWFIVFLIIIFVIGYLIGQYPWFFVGLAALGVIAIVIHRINEANRRGVERLRREEERRREELRKAQERQERIANERRKEEEFNKAIATGADVCLECKTINPKRCSPGRSGPFGPFPPQIRT